MEIIHKFFGINPYYVYLEYFQAHFVQCIAGAAVKY